MVPLSAFTVICSAVLASWPSATSAQFPPVPSYLSVITSPINPNITISYKSPAAGTCNTVFSGQKQYTGYIDIPPYTLAPIQQNYSINTFFWFVEARQSPETAPLTIWLTGGPGSSSMVGLFQENGPCEVVETEDGQYGTQPRMWGWDRSSNVLYIDQPAQVGFSYDTLNNYTYDFYSAQVAAVQSVIPGRPAYSMANGTFPSFNGSATANTTEIAAHASWHFLQSWLSAFPQYNPGVRPNNTNISVAGVNLFAESYGGKYGPVFANLFEEQNTKRRNGSLPSNSTLEISLASLGIINGLIDDLIQNYYYPSFAYNNTYGIEAISQTDELNGLGFYSGTGQCYDSILACRQDVNATDPDDEGDVQATNEVCKAAQLTCYNISNSYYGAGYNAYDVRIKNPSPYPPLAYLEYLNTASVQSSIGARVNYTESNAYVQNAFISTGDTIRGGQLEDIANLLTMGVRVALIYGDADYICNWFGGEAVSFAIAAQLPNYPNSTSSSQSISSGVAGLSPTANSTYLSGFNAAGYADIVVNSTYVGGAVRQWGNLSFSRIYDSGHMVPFYQPETAFTLFTRIIDGTDLSTGEPVNPSNHSSTGPRNATHTNSVPAQPSPTCWIRALRDTCSTSQIAQIVQNKGVVIAGVWYADASDYTPPSTSVTAGVPGTPIPRSTSSQRISAAGSSSSAGGGKTSATLSGVAPVGVYTATATPSSSQGAAAGVVWGRRSAGGHEAGVVESSGSAAVTLLLSLALGLGLWML